MSGPIVNGRRYQRKNVPGDRRSRPPIIDAPLARLVLFSELVMVRDPEQTLCAAARLVTSRREAAGRKLGPDSAIRRVREIAAAEREIRGDDPANYVPPDIGRGVSILETVARDHGYAVARHVLIMALADRMAGTCNEPVALWACVLAAQSMVASVECGFQGVVEIAAEVERALKSYAMPPP